MLSCPRLIEEFPTARSAEDRLLECFENRLAEMSDGERERAVNAALAVDLHPRETGAPC